MRSKDSIYATLTCVLKGALGLGVALRGIACGDWGITQSRRCSCRGLLSSLLASSHLGLAGQSGLKLVSWRCVLGTGVLNWGKGKSAKTYSAKTRETIYQGDVSRIPSEKKDIVGDIIINTITSRTHSS